MFFSICCFIHSTYRSPAGIYVSVCYSAKFESWLIEWDYESQNTLSVQAASHLGPPSSEPRTLPESPQRTHLLLQPLAQCCHSTVTQSVRGKIQACQVFASCDHTGQLLAADGSEVTLHQSAERDYPQRLSWGKNYNGTMFRNVSGISFISSQLVMFLSISVNSLDCVATFGSGEGW